MGESAYRAPPNFKTLEILKYYINGAMYNSCLFRIWLWDEMQIIFI